MNRYWMVRSFIVFLLANVLFMRAGMGQATLEERFAKLSETAAAKNFSGIVVAEKDGKVIASQSFGYADADSKTSIDSKTLFEIGSVTKPFTALAVIALEEAGKLSLDDSISKHLPDVPDNCRDITIRHLMQHTSGIPGTNYGPHSTDVGAVTRAYLRGGPKQQPGTRFEYWNQGYALLAAIIAKNSKQSYQRAMQELVLRPNDMNASCFTGDEPPTGYDVSIGRSTRGADRSALDHPDGNTYGLQYQGMGGLVTNAEELGRFVRAMQASETLQKKVLQPGPDGRYGLGWQIEKRGNANRRIFHSGAVRGFLAAVSWYPEQDGSIIVLANTDDRRSFFFVESSCRKAFESTIIPLPVNQQFDDAFRKSMIGQFTLGSRVVTISESGQGLEMVIDWGGAKTFGKLAKSDSDDRLRYLDGSDDEIFVTFQGSDEKPFQSMELLDQTYVRRK